MEYPYLYYQNASSIVDISTTNAKKVCVCETDGQRHSQASLFLSERLGTWESPKIVLVCDRCIEPPTIVCVSDYRLQSHPRFFLSMTKVNRATKDCSRLWQRRTAPTKIVRVFDTGVQCYPRFFFVSNTTTVESHQTLFVSVTQVYNANQDCLFLVELWNASLLYICELNFET